MTTEFFSSVGKIAGLAGLSIALVLYIIFRVMKSMDATKDPASIDPNQKFSLLKYIITGVFSLGALGILTWAFVTIKTNKKNETDPGTITSADSIINIPDSIKGLKDSDKTKIVNNPIKPENKFDSLKYLAIEKLKKFEFPVQDKMVLILFNSDLLKFSRTLAVPLKMKCSELKKMLVNELGLNEIISLKDREYIQSKTVPPELKWTAVLDHSSLESGNESFSFKKLNAKDNSSFKLQYKWEPRPEFVINTRNEPMNLVLDSSTNSFKFISSAVDFGPKTIVGKVFTMNTTASFGYSELLMKIADKPIDDPYHWLSPNVKLSPELLGVLKPYSKDTWKPIKDFSAFTKPTSF